MGLHSGQQTCDALRVYVNRILPFAGLAGWNRMQEIRRIIRSVAPDAVEHFSYRIPGFRLDGRVFVYYAAFKEHTSLYPMGAKIRRANAAALKGFKMSTGTIQFPLNRPLPVALVKRLIKARATEVRALS